MNALSKTHSIPNKINTILLAEKNSDPEISWYMWI